MSEESPAEAVERISKEIEKLVKGLADKLDRYYPSTPESVEGRSDWSYFDNGRQIRSLVARTTVVTDWLHIDHDRDGTIIGVEYQVPAIESEAAACEHEVGGQDVAVFGLGDTDICIRCNQPVVVMLVGIPSTQSRKETPMSDCVHRLERVIVAFDGSLARCSKCGVYRLWLDGFRSTMRPGTPNGVVYLTPVPPEEAPAIEEKA